MRNDLPRRRRTRGAPILPRVALCLGLAIAAIGCGGSPSEQPGARTPVTSEAASKAPTAPPGHMLRADVEQALSQGPAWILQRVVPKEVIRGGAFVGWQIAAMPESWSSTGLQQGDIVTKVNGLSIEKPDDLWKVWVALLSAPELSLNYERGGEAKALVMPIDGPPTLTEAALKAKMQARSGARSSPAGTRETIVIPGSDPAQDGSDAPPP